MRNNIIIGVLAALALGLLLLAPRWIDSPAAHDRDSLHARSSNPAPPLGPEGSLGDADPPTRPSGPTSTARGSAPAGLGSAPLVTLRPDARPAEQPSLDAESQHEIARRLDLAVDRARRERGIHVADRLVDLILTHGSVRVIVARSADASPLEPRLAGSRHGSAHYHHNIPFATLSVGPQALLTLLESPDITGIEEDEINYPALFDSVPIIHADDAVVAGYDGTDRVVVILDTGVDTDHPFFADRLVDEACFSSGSDCPNGGRTQLGPGAGESCSFGCAHGNYVAGAALGYDATQPLQGVASDASLISIQVYSDEGGEPGAWTSDIVLGLEHAYDLRAFHDIASVNMSLGGSKFSDQASCDSSNAARKAIIDLLRAAGIATIISAGNDGYTDSLAAPGCISSAISVGATTKLDDVASFSNSASFLSLLAPGVSIRTATLGGGYTTASGTSLSAPHVAGAWASILDAAPGSSVAEVLSALQSTGTLIIDGRNGLATARIDVMAAIEVLAPGDEEEGPGDSEDAPVEDAPSSGTTASASSGSRCGLVGLEILAPLLLSGGHRLRSRTARRASGSSRTLVG